MADGHDRRIKDLIGNREFAIAFMQQYMAQELVDLVDWATFELDTANVEHLRQQHKNNVKQKELGAHVTVHRESSCEFSSFCKSDKRIVRGH